MGNRHRSVRLPTGWIDQLSRHEELLVTALKQGAPVLGAAPRYDSDPSAQIDRIFALAREYDVDLDLHLDVGDNPRIWMSTASWS